MGAIKQGLAMSRITLAILISILSCSAEAQDAAALSSAAYGYLAQHGNPSRPQLRTFSFDLNEDGRLDAIVLLTGNKWCGSGGCKMLVFQGTATGFSFVSASSITREPVAVLRETTHGWHTLVVASGDVGRVLMRFNGRTYPSNPSMQPRASLLQTKEAQQLSGEILE